jgi:hypothetical protein
MAIARPLKDIQDAIAAAIKANTPTANLHIISQDKGDIDTKIDEAKSSAENGIFAVIEVLNGKRNGDQLKFGIDIAITITEFPILNRTGTSYLTWDGALVEILGLFCTPMGNANAQQIIFPEGFQVVADTGNEVTVQITARTNVKWAVSSP